MCGRHTSIIHAGKLHRDCNEVNFILSSCSTSFCTKTQWLTHQLLSTHELYKAMHETMTCCSPTFGAIEADEGFNLTAVLWASLSLAQLL